MSEELRKVDSAVEGVVSPIKEKAAHRRASSAAAPGVMNIDDFKEQGLDLEIDPETQKTGWKINKSPATTVEADILKRPLTKPPIKRIELRFPMGLKVMARNLKGVTIKDALDAMYKANKKRGDDELEEPYLAGFEWDKEESWNYMLVHLQKDSSGGDTGSKKKKKNKDAE